MQYIAPAERYIPFHSRYINISILICTHEFTVKQILFYEARIDFENILALRLRHFRVRF